MTYTENQLSIYEAIYIKYFEQIIQHTNKGNNSIPLGR